MKRIGKNFLATIGVIVILALILLLAKGISMIPLGIIWKFLIGNWPGLLIGVGISYLGMIVGEICFSSEEKKTEKNWISERGTPRTFFIKGLGVPQCEFKLRLSKVSFLIENFTKISIFLDLLNISWYNINRYDKLHELCNSVDIKNFWHK